MLPPRHKARSLPGPGVAQPRLLLMFLRTLAGKRRRAPADAKGLRSLDPLHFGSVAWNGMVNAALTLGSWERKEAGNDAILKSACAVPATGCFRDISLCSDDLDLVGRANHTGRAVTLAGLADLETGPAHCCHRRGGLGLVQGGKGALEGRRKRARRLRFAAGGVRQDPAARPARRAHCHGWRVAAQQLQPIIGTDSDGVQRPVAVSAYGQAAWSARLGLSAGPRQAPAKRFDICAAAGFIGRRAERGLARSTGCLQGQAAEEPKETRGELYLTDHGGSGGGRGHTSKFATVNAFS